MDPRSACTLLRGWRLLLVTSVVALTCLAFTAVAGAASFKQIWGTGTPTWTVQLPGSGISNDSANATVMTSSGVTYVTGALGNSAGNTDLSLTEIVAGHKKWTKTYNGPAQGSDGGQKIALGPKGIVYTAGWTTNSAGNIDMLLVKWSPAGKKIWVRTYNGPKHGADSVAGLGVDTKGNVTVFGPSVGPYGNDYAVVSWTATGVKRAAWRYVGSGHGNNIPTDLLVAKDSTVYVTGWAWVLGGKFAAVTAKFSAKGKHLWTRTYAGADALGAGGNALAACPKGGVYVGGYVNLAATGTDALILRYTAAGSSSVFARDTDGATGTTAQWFNDIAVTTGGYVIGAGATAENDSDGDAYFKDYAPSGAYVTGLTVAWGPWVQAFNKVTTDKMGGYYLAGSIYTSATASDIILYRGSQNLGGNFWQCIWGNDASHVGLNLPSDVAVSGTTVYVAGSCATAAAGTDQIALGFAY
jgi:hypothetical protein